MRHLIMLFLSMFALIHMPAYALGLGEMMVRSNINEPLDADIALLSPDNTALNSIKVALARPEDFQRAGVTYVPVLDHLHFRVIENRPDRPVINVSSNAPINAPFLNFLIVVDWPNGRLVREYTALLDPPATTQRKALKIEPSDSRITFTPVQAAPPVVNTVKTMTGTTEYGPVKPKETLWSIAERTRPNGVTTQQMIVALQRVNPQAFVNGDTNQLRKGYILRVPDPDEIFHVSPDQATAIFSQQLNSLSTNARQSSNQAENKVQPDAASNHINAPKQDTATADQPRNPLQIATERPDGDAEAGGGRGAIDTDDQLTEQLIQARKNAETARQETHILRSEIDGLQARLSDMRRLLTLKDAQLARFQTGIQQQAEDASRRMPAAGSVAPDTPVEQQPSGQVVQSPGEQMILPNVAASSAAEDATEPVVLPDHTDAQTGKNIQTVSEPVAAPKNWWDRALIALSAVWAYTLKNPIYLAGLGIALLLLLVFLVMRRKHNEQTVEQIAVQDPFDTGYAAAPPPAVDMPLDEHDPINQADLHIAYGRFQQAEDLLKEAQTEFPQRLDIRHKLFEVYHATQNKAAFNELAQQMLNDNQHLGDPDAWATVVAMGTELDPDNPLFNSVTPDHHATPHAAEVNEIAFDLAEPQTGKSNDHPPKKTQYQDVAAIDMTPALDQPLDIEQAFRSVVNENKPVADMHESSDPENEEAKNKLDLARVYIEMGDAAGARDILREVQAEGSQRQRSQAAELLAQMG